MIIFSLEKTKVAGMRSEEYLSMSDASAPERVARLTLWISSTLPTAGSPK